MSVGPWQAVLRFRTYSSASAVLLQGNLGRPLPIRLFPFIYLYVHETKELIKHLELQNKFIEEQMMRLVMPYNILLSRFNKMFSRICCNIGDALNKDGQLGIGPNADINLFFSYFASDSDIF